MLRIYPVILEWLVSLAPIMQRLERIDRSLSDQLRRSSSAVCLNTAEGMGATGRSRTQCYRVALREMYESIAALDIAERLHGLPQLSAHDADRQQRILATLTKLAMLDSR